MLLEGENAVVYGVGGSIGGERAGVCLAGRTPESLEAVAAEIRSGGGALREVPLSAKANRRWPVDPEVRR